MSIPLVINGTTYSYPETGDVNWGADATDWASAVTVGMLQKAGGLFQLLAEVDFGTTYGIKSVYLKSRATYPASTGQVRLGNTEGVYWRNAANGADVSLTVDASNIFQFTGAVTMSGALTASNFSGSSSGTNTGDVTLGAFGSTPAAEGASLSGQVLTLQPASATHPGGVSTGTQTFVGAKTFSNNITLSGTGNSVGTITSGIWNGTAIGSTYGGTGISTAASTGVAQVAAGTWSVGTTLPSTLTLQGVTTFPGSSSIDGSGNFISGSTTDSSSTSTGSIHTAGGLGVAKAAYIGTTLNVAGTSTMAAINASGVIAGTSSSTNTLGNSANTVPLQLYRDASAGDSTNSVFLRLGNQSSNHGYNHFYYTNAAAAASPVGGWAFIPRNNAGSGAVQAGSIIFTKDAGADTATLAITANSVTTSNNVTVWGTLRVNGGGTANGSNTVTISNVAPAGVATATISGWLAISVNGTTSYIPYWR